MSGRLCTRCQRLLPAESFLPDARYAGGLRSWCNGCYTIYKREHRDRARALERQAKYGITVEDQAAMWVDQGGLCASCSQPFPSTKETHLDHDHATGRVRAFLCGACNHIVGRCGEDVDHLVAVAEYLIEQRKHEQRYWVRSM